MSFLPSRRTLLAGLAGVLFCLLCGVACYQVAYASLAGARLRSASQELSSFAVAVRSLLTRHEALPRVLALDRRIVSALQREAGAVDAANRYLQDVAGFGGLQAAYVIDPAGNTIASSNWQQTTSFVGRNFSFRPYFQDALRSGFGSMYAVGTTSGEPGYFLASPIRAQARVVGVMVVKVDLRGLQASRQRDREPLAIVDEFGVVFLSSDPALLYRTLGPLDAGVQAVLKSSRRYAGEALRPLLLQGTLRADGEAIELDLGGPPRQAVAILQHAQHAGWQMLGLADMGSTRSEALATGIGGGFAGAFVVAALLLWMARRNRLGELARSREYLLRSEARLKDVANSLPVMVCVIDRDLRYVFVNIPFAQVYHVTPEEVQGRSVEQVVSAAEWLLVRPQLERALAGETVVFEREYGSQRDYRCFEATYQPEWNLDRREVTGLHVVTREVTEFKRQLSALADLAQLDHLTQVLNRKGFEASLAAALDETTAAGHCLALFFIDLDGFKAINDSLGHAAGDAVLRVFSSRLSRAVRSTDTVARLGGDEFAVIVSGIAGLAVAERLASSIVANARMPIDIDGRQVVVGASVGVAFQQGGGTTDAALCRRADECLYQAKRAGRSTFCVEGGSAAAAG